MFAGSSSGYPRLAISLSIRTRLSCRYGRRENQRLLPLSYALEAFRQSLTAEVQFTETSYTNGMRVRVNLTL